MTTLRESVTIERIRDAAAVLDGLNAEILDDSPLDHSDVADIGWTAEQLRKAADWREATSAITEATTLALVLHQVMHECARADCEFDHITDEENAQLNRIVDVLLTAGWRHDPNTSPSPHGSVSRSPRCAPSLTISNAT